MKPITIIAIVLLLILGYASVWVFNHINAWLGIAFGVIVIFGAIKFLINKL